MAVFEASFSGNPPDRRSDGAYPACRVLRLLSASVIALTMPIIAQIFSLYRPKFHYLQFVYIFSGSDFEKEEANNRFLFGLTHVYCGYFSAHGKEYTSKDRCRKRRRRSSWHSPREPTQWAPRMQQATNSARKSSRQKTIPA